MCTSLMHKETCVRLCNPLTIDQITDLPSQLRLYREKGRLWQHGAFWCDILQRAVHLCSFCIYYFLCWYIPEFTGFFIYWYLFNYTPGGGHFFCLKPPPFQQDSPSPPPSSTVKMLLLEEVSTFKRSIGNDQPLLPAKRTGWQSSSRERSAVLCPHPQPRGAVAPLSAQWAIVTGR